MGTMAFEEAPMALIVAVPLEEAVDADEADGADDEADGADDRADGADDEADDDADESVFSNISRVTMDC